VDNSPSDPNPLNAGLYEHLLSGQLARALCALSDQRLAELEEVDPGDAHAAAAQYLEALLISVLARFRGEEANERQRRLVNRIIATLTEEMGTDWGEAVSLADPLRRLITIHRQPQSTRAARPDTPLARSALLTGTRLDPSLALQLQKEIASADRVDVLCSFIKWSGLRLILPDLRRLASIPHPDGPRLRVITTSYMGATDPRAVEALRELPNTEVRISYDTSRTRLHAKAYLIHRATGFGSAYVGSANLSHAALSEGLEWTSKISQYELPHLWRRVVATFDAYWNDDEFEAFTTTSEVRLRQAIARERGGSGDSATLPMFDLRPYPFQEEILDVLAAEREVRKKTSHLVVAATGTGKTMIAAFDYRRWSEIQSCRPSLLFVAHREEILRQAIGTYRAVLRDQNFGDLLVGGSQPAQSEHLFCSIQTYNSRELWKLPEDQFRYVVVDEFHHAAAPSYRRLLDHVRPQVLLGLTATPERSDALDIFHWFGGEASAEIRLPDAINRRLLSPFQYFGIADSVDLDTLRWQRGGYRADDLDRVYTGNDARAGLVLEKLNQYVLAPGRMRALGFCVSVAHAQFMARFFTEHGLKALALSAESTDQERRAAQDRLRRYEINALFVVDLYNEGVDIPEIDTVLFLRPTESLTVFLQQLGRGLRLHHDKDCLTVLDFIGAQRREFRYAPRFRALSGEPAARVDREIEAGFPHLPPGCSVQLERVAQERVLRNVRESISLRHARVIDDLRQLAGALGRAPTLSEALDHLDTSIDELLKRGSWSRLLFESGSGSRVDDPDEERLAKGIRRLCHIDEPHTIGFLLSHLASPRPLTSLTDLDRCRLSMLHVSLWGSDGDGWELDAAETRFRGNHSAYRDLLAVLEHRLAHARVRPHDFTPIISGPLGLHATYTRDEALVGLGHWSMLERPAFREGVLHLAKPKVDAFFVTLNKTEDAYSPTTMYEDYAISDRLFHWQSQSTTSAESPTGQRYIRHREHAYTPLLFVREHKYLSTGLAAPYSFLGPADYVSHEGSRPISIVWRLVHSMPARLVRTTARQSVG
jgi:superfamily II DNA or RNA helicase